MSIVLGRLEEVDVRELWKHEQYDFSNWLAKEDNISLLNDALFMTLTDINKEVYVGTYRCDLVATDETGGIKVIIENQLECSNHDHLGKIITYASGLDAKVIVWIVKEAREEHRSAIEWLNNHTDKGINFFLIELHAYKIGDSLPAPKFEIIEKPNDFIKVSKQKGISDSTNKTEAARLEFWNSFNQQVLKQGKPFNIHKATTDHWYTIAVGTSEANISINLVNKDSAIDVELYIHDNKELFDKLHQQKEEIENALGFEMDWRKLENKKASRILYRINGLNFDNQSNYETLMDAVIEKVKKIREVFKKYF